MSATIDTQHVARRRQRDSGSGTEPRQRLLSGLPLTERRLEIAGISTVVLEGGAGPPLVLLHGGIECGGVYWAPVAAGLAQAHRLVVPDLPGLGESAPVARLDDATFGEWFRALLDCTCSGKPALVAHSLGGPLAARFAARHRDLLRSLVLYGAPGVGPYRMPVGLIVAAVRLDLRQTQRNLERFERWAFAEPGETKGRAPEWFEAFDAYSLSCGRVPHVKKAMRQLIKANTRRIPDAELRLIDVPTSLLWGRRDRMVPLSLAQGAGGRLGWPLDVVDGAGHAPHLEEPEAFSRALHSALGRS
jgi:2-hydroxymuconate-semialdehyde hydrolase